MTDKVRERHMSEKFVFEGDKDELRESLKSLLKEYNFRYDNDKIDLLIKLLEQLPESNIKDIVMDPDDIIDKHTIIYGGSGPNTIGLLVSKTRYFINIKRTTILIIAFLIDFFFSKGIITLTLTLLGQVNRTIYKLNDKELIILKMIKELKRDNECVTVSELINKLDEKTITKNEILEIIEKLKSNDIISVKGKCLEITL